MVIREFLLGDEFPLYAVFHSAVHDIASRDYTPEQVEAWAPADFDRERWAWRIRDLHPFVAVSDGRIVGYADLQGDGYIDHFFVAGDMPRRGVGRLLMTRILETAAQRELSMLTSDVSLTAQPFFQHFGFDVVEQRTPEIRGVVIPNALMRKNLLTSA